MVCSAGLEYYGELRWDLGRYYGVFVCVGLIAQLRNGSMAEFTFPQKSIGIEAPVFNGNGDSTTGGKLV